MMDTLLQERIAAIRLLVLDVDGVLTDGKLLISSEGTEWKSFDVKDGHGIRLLLYCGIEVAIISGRSSRAVEKRVRDLGIRHYYPSFRHKLEALEHLLKVTTIATEQIACMGDDLPDLPLMKHVGVSCAPADAHPEVLDYVDWVAASGGGRGAVRELTDLLLKQQSRWQEAVRRH